LTDKIAVPNPVRRDRRWLFCNSVGTETEEKHKQLPSRCLKEQEMDETMRPIHSGFHALILDRKLNIDSLVSRDIMHCPPDQHFALLELEHWIVKIGILTI
jgi:hypothetical protein